MHSKLWTVGVLGALLSVLAPAATALAATAPASAPQTPAVQVATDGLRLTWAAPADSGSGYSRFDILRGETPGSLTQVTMVDPWVLGYGDALSAGTAADHDYYYAVRANGGYGGAGPLSDVVLGHTPAAVNTGSSVQAFTLNHTSNAGLQSTRTATTFLGPADMGVWRDSSTGQYGIGGSEGSQNGTLTITAPTGGLTTGDIPVGAAAGPGTASLLLYSHYRTCQPTGVLHIAELAFNSAGVISILDMDYTLRCPGGTSDVVGSVRYHSARLDFTGLHFSPPEPTVANAVLNQTTDLPLTVTNRGTSPLTIGAPTLSADDFAYLTPLSEWTVDAGSCAAAPIAAGQSCALTLHITATATGQRGVVVHVPHDGPLGVSEIEAWARVIAKPGQPTGLHLERDLTSPRIQWDQHDLDYDSRTQSTHIYRGTDPNALTEVGTVAGFLYVDSDTSLGVRYYAVQPENSAGLGPMSAIFRLVVGPDVPAHINALGLARSVGFSVTPPDGWSSHAVTGYAFYSGPTSAVTTRTVQSLPYSTKSLLAPGTRYYWQAAALYDDGSEGPRSAVTSAAAGSAEFIVGCAARTASSGNAVQLPRVPLAWRCSDAAVSRDGRRVAFSALVEVSSGNYRRDLYVMPLDGSAAPTMIAPGGTQPTWAGDGVMISFTHLNTINQVSSRGGVVGSGFQAGLVDPTYLGMSKTLVAVDMRQGLGGLVTIGQSGAGVAIAGSAGGSDPSGSPDGKKVAYVVPASNGTSSLRVVTIGGSTLSITLAGTASGPSWSPDSSVIYFTQWDPPTTYSLRRLVVATKAVSTLGTGFGGPYAQPDFTPPSVRITAPTVTSTTATSVKVAWSASDLQAGVSTSDLRYRRAKGTGALSGYLVAIGWTRTTASYKTLAVSKGYRYCFSVRSRDRDSNTSAWTAERCITVK